MPPKKVQPDSEELSLKDIMTELSAIKNKLDKVDTLETKLDSLKTKLDSMAEENKKLAKENGELKAQLKSQEETIEAMKVGLDAVERHQRTWSVRVFNIPLTAAEERDPVLTMKGLRPAPAPNPGRSERRRSHQEHPGLRAAARDRTCPAWQARG